MVHHAQTCGKPSKYKYWTEKNGEAKMIPFCWEHKDIVVGKGE